ncbi:MAG TPA: hypothetical protein VNM87_06650 [Candidatus Udaeobacter sp.]|nr:hypothetical protein [Candidatus Udaeobacter sp.]
MSLIDPALAAELTTAGADDPVAALIVVQEELRPAFTGDRGIPAVGAESELAALIAQAVAGAEPAGWTVELYPKLAALYVCAPAAALARLVSDPGVASATVPDQGP